MTTRDVGPFGVADRLKAVTMDWATSTIFWLLLLANFCSRRKASGSANPVRFIRMPLARSMTLRFSRACFDAVHVGHLDVRDDQVWLMAIPRPLPRDLVV